MLLHFYGGIIVVELHFHGGIIVIGLHFHEGIIVVGLHFYGDMGASVLSYERYALRFSFDLYVAG